MNWNYEPAPILESDKDFMIRLREITKSLSENQKRYLWWIVNRSYFTGYKHAEQDNKGKQ